MVMEAGQEQAQAPAEGGGGQEAAQVFNDVASGLSVVTKAVMESQAPDEIKSRMQGVMQEFMGILQELTGGGGAQPQGGAQPAEQVGQPFSPAGVQ